MTLPASKNVTVRVGPFEAKLSSKELYKIGARLRVANQSFQILALLLERPGELVTREEIRQKLWPSDTFVEYDQGLNAAVNRLRDALGDSANKPNHIETLPRRGYRFLGEIETPRAESSQSPATSAGNPSPAVAIPAPPENGLADANSVAGTQSPGKSRALGPKAP